MISKNLDGERGAMEVMYLGFESMNNRQEFLIVDIVVLFCWGKGLRKV